ncbi:D930048N14Rik [Phodopus roborovskii]|uniref:D930048N14Rik protein n=1 Tax=Phodopus roborovskii TaxID=109678 RepID=A0AAU9Z399_PHORO|nr:D930048N14Rik [Phodopus roborovskii]
MWGAGTGAAPKRPEPRPGSLVQRGWVPRLKDFSLLSLACFSSVDSGLAEAPEPASPSCFSSSSSGPRPPLPVSFPNQLPNWRAGVGWSRLCSTPPLSQFLYFYLYMGSGDRTQVLRPVQQGLCPLSHPTFPICNVLPLYQANSGGGWWLCLRHPRRKDWISGAQRHQEQLALGRGVYPLNSVHLLGSSCRQVYMSLLSLYLTDLWVWHESHAVQMPRGEALQAPGQA